MLSHRYEGAWGGMGGGLLHLFRSSVDSSSTSSRKQKTGYCRPSSLSRSSFILRLNFCRKAAMHPILVASGAQSRVSYCILLWKHHDITQGTVWNQNRRRWEQKRRIKTKNKKTNKTENVVFFLKQWLLYVRLTASLRRVSRAIFGAPEASPSWILQHTHCS